MHINGKISYKELEQTIFILKKKLVGSYLKNVYHFDGQWMFKFNHMSFVYDHGNCIWMGKFKERETQLHSISIKLRKEIRDKKLVNIDIVDDDRTIVLEFKNHLLVFEVYAKGNIILLNKEDHKIIVLTRLYPNCYHHMKYKLNEFKQYGEDYKLDRFGWKIKNNEIIEKEKSDESDFENIFDALVSLWELKYQKKETKIINSKKKKHTVKDHLDNQVKNFNKKINKKIKKLEVLENNTDYDSIDYKQINKIYAEKKKLDAKLDKAKKVCIQKRKTELKVNKRKNENVKIELTTSNWYQKYHWWFTKNGFLVVGGRNVDDNEKLVKTYMKVTDYYFHTEESGSGSFILITDTENAKKSTPDEIDFDETAEGVLALSKQWNSSYTSGEVYYVKGDQVSKTPNSGEYITKGSFIIRGKRNFVKVTGCTLGYGLYKQNQLMLAPYRIINRLNSGKVKIIPSSKKTKGKILSNLIKRKLNIMLPENIALFNRPCKVT